MNSKPIGVFDSGLGGLTVVKQIKKFLPNEDIIYLGDTARVPYGTRSKKIVTKFSLEDAKFLQKKKVKCIVIACNTASSLSYKEVLKEARMPVFDVVTSGARYALGVNKDKSIGVIGTRGTINSHSYKKHILSNNKKYRVLEIACPLFVPVIEEGETEGKLVDLLVKKYLYELKNKKIKTLILGCTHYPLIQNSISDYLGDGVDLVDPGYALARNLSEYLEVNNMKKKGTRTGDRYYLTDYTKRFIKVAEKFLGKKIDRIKQIELENV